MQPFSWHELKKLWPVAVLLAVELILAATNYRPGTYLLGWDNVMPEFNFPQAFITNIFGAWQEHRGVGLPDGMGHAANLVHTVFLWLLSAALPQNMLRYAFHFLMHLAGMLGMLRLLRTLSTHGSDDHKHQIVPLLGALFYGLNLITIQMFYTPLEAFSVHFAVLPWLVHSLSLYLHKPHRNTLLLFITISFLGTPQYFIPTLIMPTALLLVFVALPHIRKLRHLFVAGAMYLAVNAFWLLPYAINLPYNAPIIQSAKINQMSSGEVYARNRAFGDLTNVLTFRGFMLDFEDVDQSGMPIHVLYAWRTWIQTPVVQVMAWAVVFLMLNGAIATLLNKDMRNGAVPYLFVFVGSGLMLANNTPGISDVMGFLRDRIPLFAEAYRFPFTKFSLLFGFGGTILATLGLRVLVRTLRRITRPGFAMGMAGVSAAAIIYAALPIFRGGMFYDALRVHLPVDYPALFNFMDKQDHFGRTAYLPQPSFWSWKHYRFGAVGSGFVWYGLPQPLMDRAFDQWSNVNETYYWELSRAIYTKDPEALSSVFRKYDIRYVIVDGYLSSPSHDRSLFMEETKQLLSLLPDTKAIGTTGDIIVYERTPTTTAYVRTSADLPIVTPPYAWTDNDIAYQTYGDYTTSTAYEPSTTTLFPFRSLFTKRAINEGEFTITSAEDSITLASRIAGFRGIIDTAVPAFSTHDNGLLTPSAVKSCGVLKTGPVQTEQVKDARGREGLRITSLSQRACVSIGSTNLPHAQGYVLRVSSRHVTGRPLQVSIINNTAKHIELDTFLPETVDWQDSYLILPPLAADGLGYTIYLTNDAIGNSPTTNDIGEIAFYTLPYEALVTASNASPVPSATPLPIHSDAVDHINPSWYTLSIPDSTSTVILSQAHNPLWAAYDVTGLAPWKQTLPMVFGTMIPTHFRVNNWANGWQLAGNEREIAIIFVPQYLEYIGLIILLSIAIITIGNYSIPRRSDR